MIQKQAAEALRRAESEIAAFATSAAGHRDYDVAERLLGIARHLANTANKLSNEPSPSNSNSALAATAPPSASLILDDGESTDDQPLFESDGENLIKRGKSKSDSKEYEHKAPHAVINTLLEAIRESANKKGEFRTNRILPLKDSAGQEIPSYQGYLALRWLRQIGLVNRVARQRYALESSHDPISYVEQAWRSLPQR